jgi:hypothetical protein
MTTREKIAALADELRQMSLADCDESTRGLVEIFQIIQGLGYDPLAQLLPTSDAEADQQVDALIALLFQIRGDDLPPFNLEQHVTDATAMDA